MSQQVAAETCPHPGLTVEYTCCYIMPHRYANPLDLSQDCWLATQSLMNVVPHGTEAGPCDNHYVVVHYGAGRLTHLQQCFRSLSTALTSALKSKGNGFPYSLPSVRPGADTSVQAVSPQVTSHPAGSKLPLLSVRPAVTFPAAEHHRPLAGTKLYCLVTDAHKCEQLAQVVTQLLSRVGFEPTTCWSQVQRSTYCAIIAYRIIL